MYLQRSEGGFLQVKEQERLAQYQQDVMHNEVELKKRHQEQLEDAQARVQQHAQLLERSEAAHSQKVCVSPRHYFTSLERFLVRIIPFCG
jgi:hypothetical protein